MRRKGYFKKSVSVCFAIAALVVICGTVILTQGATGEEMPNTLQLIDAADGVKVEKTTNGIHLSADGAYRATIADVFTGNAEIEFTIDGNADEWTEKGLALEHIYNFRVASVADPNVYFDIAYQYLDDLNWQYNYGPSWNKNGYSKDTNERTAQKLVPLVYYKHATNDGENFILKTRYSDRKATDYEDSNTYHDEFFDRDIRWDEKNKTAGDFYYKAHGSKYDEIDSSKGCFGDLKNTKFSLEWNEDGILGVYNYRTNGGTLEKYVVAQFDDGAHFCGLPDMKILQQGYTITLMSDCEYTSSFKRVQNVTNRFDYSLLPYYDYNDITNNMRTDLGVTIHSIAADDKITKMADETFAVSEGTQRYAEFASGTAEIVFPEYYSFENVGVGNSIKIPLAVYSSKGKAASFINNITIKHNDSETEVLSGEEYTLGETGEYEICYLAENTVRTIRFNAIEYGYDIDKIVSGNGFAQKTTADGIMLNPDTNQRYNADIAGVFKNKFSVKFKLKAQYGKYSQGDNAVSFRITDAADPSMYFNVAYYLSKKSEGSFGVAVAFRDEKEILYRSTVPGGGNTCDPDEALNFAPFLRGGEPNGYGEVTLTIQKDRGVYKVLSEGRDGRMYTIAAFDGSYNNAQNNYGFSASGKWGLPKLSFANGFKVSVCAYCDEDKLNRRVKNYSILLKNINGVNLCGAGGVAYTPGYDVKISGAIEKDGKTYVPQGVGKEISSVYSLGFARDGSWNILFNSNEQLISGFDDERCGEQTLVATGNYLKNNFPGGKTMTAEKNVTVEPAYSLSFDTAGGMPLSAIVYSEHTLDEVVIPEAYKAGYEFIGWRVNGVMWNGKPESLADGNKTLVAQWKYTGRPSISLKAELKNSYQADETILISSDDIIFGDFTGNLTCEFTVTDPAGNAKKVANGSKIILESGIYVITYKVTNILDSSAEVQRQIHVGKNIAPAISVFGSFAGEYIAGNTVKLPNASATDCTGKAVEVVWNVLFGNVKIDVANGSFIAKQSGEYEVRCVASDENGNIGYLEWRIVVKNDEIAPEIRTGMTDIEAKAGETIVLPEVEAYDNADENVSIAVKVSFGTKEISLTDRKFVATEKGIYRVLITATDASGNRAEKTIYISVR